ncbi:MAG: glycosyltransferase family 39 protein [Rubrobacter sp.]|nr:glycosyltransferase family 39 protein [Rubrobacter sp.]
MESQKPIETRSFIRIPTLRLLIVGLLFIVAFRLRLYGIFNPLMDFIPVRQYHSALLARGFYNWLLTGELTTIPPDGIIEPPIRELVASFVYLIVGEECLWINRLLSVIFWMVGGVFLYHIAKKVGSPNAAVFSLAFYLFVPFGVLASRAFMPDPLMIMLLLISVFTILQYHEQPSPRRMLIAAAASSLAVFVKPIMCFFPLFGAFVLPAVCRRGVRRSLTSLHVPTFTALSILPAGLYYLYGMFAGGIFHLEGQIQDKVVLPLLFEASFWQDWWEKIGNVVGYAALLVALLGLLLCRPGLSRALMLGLWGGYFLFGLVYTAHIHTHDYYSLQLIPIVALSLSPLAALLMTQLNQLASPKHPNQGGLRYYGRVIVLTLLVPALILGAIRYEYWQNAIALPGRMVATHEREVATYQEIGEVVNHSPHTLLLFGNRGDWGYPLLYHGRFSAVLLPRPDEIGGLSTEEYFNTLYSEYSPEYFIISPKLDENGPDNFLDFWQSKEYEDLRNLLTKNFPVMVRNDAYVVFDLREKY